MFGDGDCGQLGLGEDVTERLRPWPVSVEGKQVGGGWLAELLQLLPVRNSWEAKYTSMRGSGSCVVGQLCKGHTPTTAPALQVLQVACGGMHTAVLTADGGVYTWGVNDEGALGRETGVVWARPWLPQLCAQPSRPGQL